MYSTNKSNFNDLVDKSTMLLKDKDLLHVVMSKVVNDWPKSTAQNLSDETINPRPWLGRAACCYQYGASEDIVRVAWFNLTHNEMKQANDIADDIIKNWRDNHSDNQQLELFGGCYAEKTTGDECLPGSM